MPRIGTRQLFLALATGVALALAGAAPAAADITATEGTAFTAQLGTFYDPCPTDPETHGYLCGDQRPAATIEWGDGTSSAATLTKEETGGKVCLSAPACTWEVSGTHTYDEYGTYSGTVEWGDADGGAGHGSGSFTFTADVADASISLSNVSVQRNGNQATLTATLIDDNPDGSPCSFGAEINWNDGPDSQPVPGTVEGCQLQSPDRGASGDPSTASFTVTGSHTYSGSLQPANGVAELTVTDAGGSEAQTQVTVPTPPQTATRDATSISQTSAQLNASVDADGGTIQSCEFEYGTDTSYGQTIPCGPIAEDGSTSATPTNLTPNQTYHFQVVLSTNIGTSDGGDQSFTTLSNVAAGAPTVITGVAEPDSTTATSTVVNGQVNPHGGTISDCHFQWGTGTNYGNSVPCVPATPSGSSLVPVAADISGLSPDTTYHFRLVAANTGAPESDGADATFTTLPLCNVTEKFGYVDAFGCLSDQGSTFVSTPGSTVQLDGLTLTPDDPFVTITLTPATGQIASSGDVTVSAGLIDLSEGRLAWTEPSPNNANSVTIASLDPPFGTEVAGIRLDGDMSLSFNKQDGADMAGNATLPFGSLAAVVGANGQIVLHTAPGVGLETDQLQITASGFQLLGVGVKNLKVTYDPGTDTWSGGATVVLPTPNPLNISASLAFQHGSFQKFSGSVSGLNVPVFGAVDLQQISVVFGVNPTTIGGGVGLSFGPSVNGKQLAEVDGSFLYQAATSTAAGFIDVNGSLTLASFKIANAYFEYYTSGLIKFGGQFSVGLPNSSAPNPQNQPVYISAGLAGALSGSSFDVDVQANVALNFIDLNIGANVLVSDLGIVACAQLSAFGFTWSPGVGYTWSTGALNLMASGCSIGPYETLPLGQASDAAATRRIAIRRGRSLLRLKGFVSQPRVVLSGPGSQRVAVPTGSVKPYYTRGFMVLQDPANKITWIAIEHGGGSWRLSPEAGGAGIASLRDAPLLPAPSIAGRIVHRGHRWTFSWRLRPIPGQTVVFWEKGADVARIIGSTSSGHGSLRFTPAAGDSRMRTIEAQVFSYGHPRADITVARYRAPAPPEPGRPADVRVTGTRGGAIRVSWKPAGHAEQYRIVVVTNGGQLVELAAGKATSVVVSDAVPITQATVKLSAELADGLAGRAVTVQYRKG